MFTSDDVVDKYRTGYLQPTLYSHPKQQHAVTGVCLKHVVPFALQHSVVWACRGLVTTFGEQDEIVRHGVLVNHALPAVVIW